MMTINPIMRSLVIREIYKQTDTAKSRNAVKIAADFLRDDPGGGMGEVWNTRWYYGPNPKREDKATLEQEHKATLREWQAKRDAREAKRLSQRPGNPWSAWIESLRNMTDLGTHPPNAP